MFQHRAMMAKKRFLETGEMRHLTGWRRQENVLFMFEKEAYAVFSPRELALYAFTSRAQQKAQEVVRPLQAWWYGNKAERAYEHYLREKTSEHMFRWYKAETRVAFVRGVRDWHVSYANGSPQVDRQLATEAWLLRKTRTTWAKLKPDETLM